MAFFHRQRSPTIMLVVAGLLLGSAVFAVDQMKTVQFFVGDSISAITSQIDKTFTVYIGDNLSGVSNPVKSAAFTVSGTYTGTGAGSDIGPTNVSTSDTSSATTYSQQRKTWWDGTRYWVALTANSRIEFWYSTDGSSWTENTSARLSSGMADFSIVADSSNAFIAWKKTGVLVVADKANNYPGTSFTWTDETNVYSACLVLSSISMSRDTNNKLWVAAVDQCDVGGSQIIVYQSTVANQVTAWGPVSPSINQISTIHSVVLAPLSGGDMSLSWKYGPDSTTYSKKYTSGGSWASSSTFIASIPTGTENNTSMVGNTLTDEAYLAYIGQGGKTKFRRYVDGDNAGWSAPFDSADDYVDNFTMDTTNNVVYMSTSKTTAGGVIYRCATSTSCNNSANWTVSYDTTMNWMEGSAFDAVHGIVYMSGYINAGVSSMFRCDITTTGSCNDSTDWTSYVMPGSSQQASLFIDQENSILYSGDWNTGLIFRCDTTTTLCNEATDWTSFDITTDATIFSFTKDTTNNVLYAGTGASGLIYRCLTSSLCDAAVDWTATAPVDTSYIEIRDLTFDATNGVLYAAALTGSSTGAVLRCNTTTNCDALAEWTVSYNPASTDFLSVEVDAVNEVMYAGAYNTPVIYQCPLGRSCDAASDWSQALNAGGGEVRILDIMTDATIGSIYAGTNGLATVRRYYNGWRAPVTLDTNSGNAYVSLSRNTQNDDLYTFWIRSNIIYYSKASSPYTSWSAPAALVSTGTNTWLSAAATDANGYMPFIWTSGSANPWTVKFFGKAASAGSVSLQLKINNDSATSRTFELPGVGSTPTPFEIQYKDPANTINPTTAGSYSYTLNIIPTNMTIYGLGAKLNLTYRYAPASCDDGQPSNEKIKTVESFVGDSSSLFAQSTQQEKTFSLYIGDNLTGVTNPVKSSYFVVSGSYVGSGGGLSFIIDDDPATDTSFTLPDVGTTVTPFEILYKDAWSKVQHTTPGNYTHKLTLVNLASGPIYGLGVKNVTSYRYKPPSCGLAATGDVTSTYFDTGSSDGVAFNSMMWKGNQNGSTGKVRFQIAVSNSSSGPWVYYGDGPVRDGICAPSEWYEASAAGTPVPTTCREHNNARYFRYKTQICSASDCSSSGAASAIIDDVIINWSP